MGHQAVFLLGDQGYYKRLGFATAREFGISIRLPVAADQVPETLEKIFPDAPVAIFPKSLRNILLRNGGSVREVGGGTAEVGVPVGFLPNGIQAMELEPGTLVGMDGATFLIR